MYLNVVSSTLRYNLFTLRTKYSFQGVVLFGVYLYIAVFNFVLIVLCIMTKNELIIFINTFSSTVITLIIVNSYENKSRFQFDGFEINEKRLYL